MFNKTKAGDDIAVPFATELNPRIAELESKRLAISTEKQELLAEDRELVEHHGPTDAEATRQLRVAEILGEVPPQRVVPTRSRRAEIRERIRDLEAAGEALSREIEVERNRASATAKDRLYPEYRKQVKALTNALCAAHAAQFAIRGLAAKVHDAGLSASWLWSHHAPWLDTGPHSTIGRFIHDARRAALISERDVPAELKE
ncbi:MAG: hypothetical protein JJ911_07835 [Rhizobiaceae bacterium]|nr:hypothetical protein [Rhizobiaceae bacterium]